MRRPLPAWTAAVSGLLTGAVVVFAWSRTPGWEGIIAAGAILLILFWVQWVVLALWGAFPSTLVAEARRSVTAAGEKRLFADGMVLVRWHHEPDGRAVAVAVGDPFPVPVTARMVAPDQVSLEPEGSRAVSIEVPEDGVNGWGFSSAGELLWWMDLGRIALRGDSVRLDWGGRAEAQN